VGEADWSRFTLSGVLLGLLSGFAYALFLFLTGKIQTTMHPFLKAAVMVTAALPVLYVMFPPNFSGSGSVLSLLLWGVALGMLGQAVPTIAFNIGIPRVGSALAANLGAIELPAVVVSAFFILHETVQGLQWFGMLSILAGIVIAERWK
jgi:drug/metabolite transporter (DMT)-like permease